VQAVDHQRIPLLLRREYCRLNRGIPRPTRTPGGCGDDSVAAWSQHNKSVSNTKLGIGIILSKTRILTIFFSDTRVLLQPVKNDGAEINYW